MKIYQPRKWFIFAPLTFIVASTLISACGSASDAGGTDLVRTFQEDEAVQQLKANSDLAGYYQGEVEIIGSKAEIIPESIALSKAFNEIFQTNVSFTQPPGNVSPEVFLSTKFANGVGNVLLIANSRLAFLKTWQNYLIDTQATELLGTDFVKENKDHYIIGNKAFMPQVNEAAGLIYNRDTFTRVGIIVYEGQSYQAVTDPMKPTKKGDNYNGTIAEKDKLYVFTEDLTLEGYKAINAWLRNKNINPIYPSSKATPSNLWTHFHLLGTTVASITNVYAQGDKSLEQNLSNVNNVITKEVIESLKNSLEIYGHDQDYNTTTNTIDSSYTQVGIGQNYAMVPNGTWTTPRIRRVNANVNLGFLPYPLFDKATKKPVIGSGATQRWALTTLAQDVAKKKTAQLFLRFLYATKSGLNYISNSFSFISPYGNIEGTSTKFNDTLIESFYNYRNNKAQISPGWPNLYFPSGFTNSNPVWGGEISKGFVNIDSAQKIVAEEFSKQLENDKSKIK